MPAEWERQSAIWLSWPHNLETWPENLLAAQNEFVQLVTAICSTEPVFVMGSGETLPAARRSIGALENVRFVDIPTNDAWARDYAPTFVIDSNRRLIAVNWHYNAWGGKYPPFDHDQKVAQSIADYLQIKCISPGFCIEGGAIETNGNGVMLGTRTCALDPNRNPDVSISQVETVLADHLGVQTFVWLSQAALDGDDTDGHIDQMARFTDRNTIVYAWNDDKNDPQSARLTQNYRELRSQLAAAKLEDCRLVALPIPTPLEHCGRRIPASYCNFLISNELVLVPQFGVPEDRQALEVLTPLFPSRQLVGLSSKELSVGLGSFHCLSQQQPEL